LENIVLVEEWRIIGLDINDAYMNMAIDEAILTARIKELVPNTLRFYRWKPSAVSIGRFQNVFKEIQIENCKKQGIDIVRRITGGGAVYHDFKGEITYSLIIKEKDLKSKDVIASYNAICNGLIEATKILGLKANFQPGNQRNCPNLIINGKKISGSSQRHKNGVILQHGTFLLDIDLVKMFTFLRVPWAKTITDVICIARERITSIKQELTLNIQVEIIHHALLEGFQKAFNVKFPKEEPLTINEQKLAEKLKFEKYSTKKWIFERLGVKKAS
jgi:lipoate-protein ligase A